MLRHTDTLLRREAVRPVLGDTSGIRAQSRTGATDDDDDDDDASAVAAAETMTTYAVTND
jgi:hypothetical protein